MLLFDILTRLFSSVKRLFIAALVALLPVLYTLGVMSANRKNRIKALEDENKTLRETNEIEDEIYNLPPDAVSKRLDKWMRD